MFGYDDHTLEKIRARRPVNRLVVALELLVLVVGLAVLGAAHLFTTPGGLQRVVNRLVGDAPVSVSVGDATLLPGAEPFAPETWRVLVSDLSVRPHDPDKPRFHVTRAVLGMPDLVEAWATRELAFDHVLVVGLDIHAPRQRPPEPWEPTRSALNLVAIDHVEIWDASYRAEPDPPLLEADVDLIWGELHDLRYAPGARELSGHGTLRAERFRTGAVALTHLHIDEVRAERSNVHFGGATFEYAGGTGEIEGEARDIHRRAAVTLDVALEGARAERLVENATGRESPLSGRVDSHLTLRSGGELPRGGAVIEGVVRLTGGMVGLGDRVTNLQRDLMQLAPFIQLDDRDRVVLGDATGRMRFSRGAVEVDELLYRAPRRDLRMWGRMDEGGLELTLRLVPLRDPETRPGLGIVMSGSMDALHVRLARRDELLSGAGPEPEAPDEEPTREAPWHGLIERIRAPLQRGLTLRSRGEPPPDADADDPVAQ